MAREESSKEKVNYRDTELWADSKALVLEAYKLTANWPEDGQTLANDIRQLVRSICRTVPGAFRKGGMTGNIHLNMATGSFAEVEALLEVAVALGFIDAPATERIKTTMTPIRAKFNELRKESQEHAKEAFRKQTSFFGRGNLYDDDEFW